MTKPTPCLLPGAGQIGYALAPQVARGAMLGPDQPVILHLLDIPPAAQSLEGVKMELIDAALPLLQGVPCSHNDLPSFCSCPVLDLRCMFLGACSCGQGKCAPCGALCAPQRVKLVANVVLCCRHCHWLETNICKMLR